MDLPWEGAGYHSSYDKDEKAQFFMLHGGHLAGFYWKDLRRS